MSTESMPVASDPALWVLLIGIERYASREIAALKGCVNDVEALRIFLVNQLSVPDEHIRVLINQQATRAAIIRTFQQFLIDNPTIRAGDQILFHFSGHGSRMRDTTGTEPDGYNETLVAHDSRMPGVYDIPDKTLAALLDRLAARKGDRITVMLDCCHSGSGTRRIEVPGMPSIRLASFDDRPPPPDLDADLLAGAATRHVGPSGWEMASVPYVLLASCRDRELSNEYRGICEDQEDQAERWYGTLTYFTLQNLRQVSPTTTYADLHERVAAQITAIYRSQHPQCEGDRERLLFGGMRIERDPFISVQQVNGNTVTLAAGLVHGIRPGTELALYPPQTRTRADLPAAPLATVKVTTVSATTAQARLQHSLSQLLPEHARGMITRQVYVGLRRTVALQVAHGDESQRALLRLRQAIQHAPPDGKPSPYLEIVDEPGRQVDLYVMATGGKWSIYGTNGELLIVPETIHLQGHSDVNLIVHALECIVRYLTVQTLINEDVTSQVVGRVKLRLRRYVLDPHGPHAEELPPTALSSGGELTIPFDPDRKERNLYVVDVVNESSQWIYPHVFMLNPDYSIQRLYPLYGQEEALKPDGTFSIGLGTGERPLEFYLPDGWRSSQDTLKLIATTEACDLQLLEQDALHVPPPTRGYRPPPSTPLTQLLETLLYRVGTRTMRVARTPQEDWGTFELPITTVKMGEGL